MIYVCSSLFIIILSLSLETKLIHFVFYNFKLFGASQQTKGLIRVFLDVYWNFIVRT
jgi:hypothetical protein